MTAALCFLQLTSTRGHLNSAAVDVLAAAQPPDAGAEVLEPLSLVSSDKGAPDGRCSTSCSQCPMVPSVC